MTAEHIQNVRAQLLGKLLLHNASLTRGQYEGYLEEPGVQPHSKTETFFRIALEIKDKKWKGVPVTLESGKALHHEEMSVEIFFKHTPARIKFVVSDNGTNYDAYEKVFQYCIRGDQNIFASRAEVFNEWKIAEKVLKGWHNRPLVVYQKGIKPEKIKNL